MQNGERFYEEYDLLIATSDPSFNLEPTIYAQQCYDATWTYARALNKTLMGKCSYRHCYYLVKIEDA